MFKRNSFVLIMVCALILISISSVCASDDFTNASHNQSSVDVLSQIGSFDDLEKDIGNLNQVMFIMLAGIMLLTIKAVILTMMA